jgi:hypothetical protein
MAAPMHKKTLGIFSLPEIQEGVFGFREPTSDVVDVFTIVLISLLTFGIHTPP